MEPIVQLVIAGAAMFGTLAAIAGLSGMYSLNIKAKTVGHGQHGTARWATKQEIKKTYVHVPFEPQLWRQGKNLPSEQGIVVGCEGRKTTTALVDTGDVHAIMIGAAGVGKTAYWLYPCLEYALASGMSFLSTDTKGDVVRNYGRIAQECYGYRVGVIDLRNPTKSDGFNLLHLVNKYIDASRPTRKPFCSRPRRSGMPKSSPRPSSPREWTGQTSGRTNTSSMPPRGCSRQLSFWWQSSVPQRNGTLCPCSKSSRS